MRCRFPFVALLLSVAAGAALMPPAGHAQEALIAVAANFAPVATRLKTSFEEDSPHRITVASGSTGKHYAQISNGAPFDAFLAADDVHPRRLAEQKLGIDDSRFTYALGRIGIWIPGSVAGPDQVQDLLDLHRIAVANPALAPYGAAAMSVLDRFDLTRTLKGRLVLGENVAQAYAMVASGSAQGGIIAWSHIVAGGREGESLLIPAGWHPPIRQDALLLRHGRDNPAARAFLDFLRTDPARAVIRAHGYLTD